MDTPFIIHLAHLVGEGVEWVYAFDTIDHDSLFYILE